MDLELTDDEVAANVQTLLTPLGDTLRPVPTLSSGQNVTTAAPTYAAVHSTDLLMLAGGGVAAHPDGPAAGVRSLRDAWVAAVDDPNAALVQSVRDRADRVVRADEPLPEVLSPGPTRP